MKQKTGFVALFALILSVGFLAYRANHALRPTDPKATAEYSDEPADPPSPRPKKPRKSARTRTSLRALIRPPVRNGNTEMTRASPTCREFEAGLFGIPLDRIDALAREGRLPDPTGCSPANPRAAKILHYYSLRCGKALAPGGSGITEECQVALIMTRSTLAVLARDLSSPKETSDLSAVADLLVAGFAEIHTEMSPAAVARLKAAADRMVELDPELVPGIKAGAMAAMLEAVMKKEALRQAAESEDREKPEKPDWAAFEKRIDALAELDPNDPDVDAFRRIAATQGMDPELVKKDSLARIAKNPDSARELEILAWSQWRLGETKAAQTALRIALDRDPENPDFRRNWEAIHRPGAKREDFVLSMKIGVGLSDLLD